MELEYGQQYTNLYHQHWWWRSREEIILSEISRLRPKAGARILDVGCGNGLFLPRLAEFGEVAGIEADTSLLSAESPFRDKIHTERLGSQVYEGMRFDLVTALDVIEHIEDDSAAIGHIMKMVAPGGRALFTVPALMSLWDRHDEINHHYRRYDRAALLSKLSEHGEVVRIRYLYHSLYFPKRIIAALNSKRRTGREIDQTVIPAKPVNDFLKAIMVAEYKITSLFRFPFGTSLMAEVAPRA